MSEREEDMGHMLTCLFLTWRVRDVLSAKTFDMIFADLEQSARERGYLVERRAALSAGREGGE